MAKILLLLVAMVCISTAQCKFLIFLIVYERKESKPRCDAFGFLLFSLLLSAVHESGRCLCRRVRNNFTLRSGVKDIKIHKENNFCNKLEIV